MDFLSLSSIGHFITTDLRVSTPILVAVLGLLFMERSGVTNIGAEGFMLIGALTGVMGSKIFGNVWAGALLAMVVSGVAGILYGYLVITVKANQVVIGTAFNFLGLGLTTTVYRVFFGTNTTPPKLDSFHPVFLGLSMPVFLVLLLVPLAHFILFKTEIGLKIRAVGENPKAADTVGIDVYKIRYATTIFGSMLVGFGGSFISLGLVSFFTENMVAGRGFIALAAVIFGKYTPVRSLIAVLIFGAGDALQYQFQAAGSQVPYQFILMIPYILTVVAVTGFVGKVSAPASSGKPYFKE